MILFDAKAADCLSNDPQTLMQIKWKFHAQY